jgi:hypothetical protein
MENLKLKEMGSKFLILFFLINSYISQAQIKYNSNVVNKKKCVVYYYPLEACIDCEHTTESIVNRGCYGYKFDKIKPRLFLQLDTLFKSERKTKSLTKKWSPYTVFKIQYKDTVLYLTININDTEYKRSDVVLKDSVFTFDRNIIDLLEQNVKGFKKANRNMYPKPRKNCK